MPSRLIDKLPPAPQPARFKVLVLGLPRCGTKTLRFALNRLGIPCYHSMDAAANHELAYMNEACAIKFIKARGEPYSPDDFAKFLYPYEAICDAPALLFLEEWLNENPDAKIILNIRPFEAWFRSFKSVAICLASWPWWPLALLTLGEPHCQFYPWSVGGTNYMAGSYSLEQRRDLWSDPDKFRRTYDKHYPRVRELAAASSGRHEILEFRTGEHGWKELCGFLGKEVPDEPFPHANNGSDIVVDTLKVIKRTALMNAAKRLAVLGSVVAVGAALYLRDV